MKKIDELIDKINKNPSHGYLLTAQNENTLASFTDQLSSMLVNAENEGDLHKSRFILQNQDASIKKKTLDEFLKQAKLTQGKGTRVFVINKAETLTRTSANSLLKLLEEPGDNTIFILTTLRPASVIATIQSRLQQINVPDNPVREVEINSDIKSSSKETDLIKALFVGDSDLIENYLNDEKLREALTSKVALMKTVISSDVYDRMIALKPYWKDRDGLADILELGSKLCRIAIHSSASTGTKVRNWAKAADVFLNARERVARNVSPRLVIMELVVQL